MHFLILFRFVATFYFKKIFKWFCENIKTVVACHLTILFLLNIIQRISAKSNKYIEAVQENVWTLRKVFLNVQTHASKKYREQEIEFRNVRMYILIDTTTNFCFICRLFLINKNYRIYDIMVEKNICIHFKENTRCS